MFSAAQAEGMTNLTNRKILLRLLRRGRAFLADFAYGIDAGSAIRHGLPVPPRRGSDSVPWPPRDAQRPDSTPWLGGGVNGPSRRSFSVSDYRTYARLSSAWDWATPSGRAPSTGRPSNATCAARRRTAPGATPPRPDCSPGDRFRHR